ncbi:MAG TPA: VWA domain-containing protein, partial [Acidobacteriaceae bacterium]|nr:VWA domain-containing protein [Acidobacteriaceae bacterium]
MGRHVLLGFRATRFFTFGLFRNGSSACAGLLLMALIASAWGQDATPPESRTVLKTTVRRVVLDVVVTDANGKPVSGLNESDFRVTENGQPQRILSFDANGFTPEMDYVPPQLPPQPKNTFMNLPKTPEKGPLYVLLYDLVDMDDPSQMDSPEDYRQQMIARTQMMKFIQNKPEGARFAVFVRSDGLHLVQGFTSDKAQLLATLDPHSPKPHLPPIFLMGPNFGRGNRLGALDTLHRIAVYLDGLPGRKNLIWFSGMFPLSLFAEQNDGPNFQAETKATLDLLAHNQIAVYPVDARGVALEDSHAASGTGVHSDTVTSPTESGATTADAGAPASAAASPSGSSVQGDSAVVSSFNVMDGIA